MKHKPHRLTICLSILSGAVFAGLMPLVQIQEIQGAQASQGSDSATAATAAPEITTTVTNHAATGVLEDVRGRLDTIVSLDCELHETIYLSNQLFYASGHYHQASGNRVRLQFQIFPVRGSRSDDGPALALDGRPVETDNSKPTGELTQVSNGSILWSLWKNGDTQRLTRRNIREILEAAEAADEFDRTGMLQDLGAGGLQALLARLESGMEFGKVRERMSGETRLLVLSGRWTKAALKQYFSLTDEKSRLQDWVPDYVRVYVDAEALLPRRIQYLKRHPDPEQKLAQPLVTLDLRRMKINDTVDDSLFEFTAPEGVVEEDLTQQTLQTIRNVSEQARQSQGTPQNATAADSPAD